MPGNREIFSTAINAADRHRWDSQWGEALKEYQRALTEFPEDAAARGGLGFCYMQMRHWPQALSEYEHILKSDPNHIIALSKTAELYGILNRRKDAYAAYLHLADLYSQAGQGARAEAAWQKAVQLSPGSPKPHERLAGYYFEKKDIAAMIEHRLMAAQGYLQENKPAAARMQCEGVLRADASNIRAQQLLAQVEEQAGQPSKTNPPGATDVPSVIPGGSVDLLTKTSSGPLSFTENSVAETNTLGNTSGGNTSIMGNMGSAGNFGGANSAGPPLSMPGAGGGMNQAPRKRITASQVTGVLRQAQSYQNQGRFNDAIDLCEQILESGFDRPDARYFLGWLYQEQQRWDEAIRQFQMLLNDPDYALSCYYALGQCYRARGDLQTAAIHFDEAVDRVNLDALTVEESDQLVQLCQEAAEAHRLLGEQEQALTVYNALLGFLRSRGWSEKIAQVEFMLQQAQHAPAPPARPVTPPPSMPPYAVAPEPSMMQKMQQQMLPSEIPDAATMAFNTSSLAQGSPQSMPPAPSQQQQQANNNPVGELPDWLTGILDDEKSSPANKPASPAPMQPQVPSTEQPPLERRQPQAMGNVSAEQTVTFQTAAPPAPQAPALPESAQQAAPPSWLTEGQANTTRVLPPEQMPPMPERPAPVQQVAPAPVQQVAPAPVQQVAPAPVQQVAPAPVQQVAPAPVQQVAPAPVQQVAPAPVQQVAPAPVQQVAPAPVQQVAPAPVQQVAPAPVQQVAPAPVQQVAPAPVQQVAPNPALEQAIFMMAPPPVPPVQERKQNAEDLLGQIAGKKELELQQVAEAVLESTVSLPENIRMQVLRSMQDIQQYINHGLLTSAIEECLRVIDMAPQYLDVHQILCEIYVRQGKVEQAITKYAILVDTYIVNARIDDAIATYRRILQLEPNNLTYRMRLINLLSSQGNKEDLLRERTLAAESYLRLGYIDRAMTELEQALQESPTSVATRLNYALALQKLGRVQQAVAEYQRVLQVDPRNITALVRWHIAMITNIGTPRANMLEALTRIRWQLRGEGQKHADAVLREYSQTAEIYPNNADVRFSLGQIYHQIGQFDKAIDSYTLAMRDSMVDVIARVSGAQSLLIQGKPEAAIQYLEQSLQLVRRSPAAIDPETWAARPREDGEEHQAPEVEISVSLAKAYGRTGRIDKMEAIMRQVKQGKPEGEEVASTLAEISLRLPDPASALQEYMGLVRHYRSKRQGDNALTVLNEMVRMAPQDPHAHAELADIYVGRGLLAEGIAELRLLADIHLRRNQLQEASETIQRIGNLYDEMGNEEEALANLTRAAELYSKSMELLREVVGFCWRVGRMQEAAKYQTLIARHYFETRQVKESVAALQQLIAIDRVNQDAYDMLGQTYQSVGEYEQASRVYRNLAKMHPGSTVARERLAMLQELRSK